jgi:hypothetical protein
MNDTTAIEEITPEQMQAALERAEQALAARRSLLAFGEDLKVQLAAAVQAEADGTGDQQSIDTQLALAEAAESVQRFGTGMQFVLSGDSSEKSRLIQDSAAAGDRVLAARQEQGRIKGVQAQLPKLFREADERIIEAHAALSTVAQAVRDAGCREFHADMVALAPLVAKAKMRGFALAAGGVNLRGAPEELSVPSTIGPKTAGLVHGGYAILGEAGPVQLDRAWRDDPACISLFEHQIKFTRGLANLNSDIRRIRDEREAERIRAIDPGRDAAFTRRPAPLAKPAEIMPPAPSVESVRAQLDAEAAEREAALKAAFATGVKRGIEIRVPGTPAPGQPDAAAAAG